MVGFFETAVIPALQETGESYTPLAHVFSGQKHGQFTVSNSNLSEFGILGFELGYALENPNSLVIWEAQFGDFANGAQVLCSTAWLHHAGVLQGLSRCRVGSTRFNLV